MALILIIIVRYVYVSLNQLLQMNPTFEIQLERSWY